MKPSSHLMSSLIRTRQLNYPLTIHAGPQLRPSVSQRVHWRFMDVPVRHVLVFLLFLVRACRGLTRCLEGVVLGAAWHHRGPLLLLLLSLADVHEGRGCEAQDANDDADGDSGLGAC